jgi:hypothetical protein
MEHSERGFRKRIMSGCKLLALLTLTCSMHLVAQPPTEAMTFHIGAQRIDAGIVVGAGHPSYPDLISAIKFELTPGER